MAPSLPYDVLLNVFERVLSSWPGPLPPSIRAYLPTRGGDVQACALVSREWRMPAQHVLVQHIDIGEDRITLEAPTLLLRTLTIRPDLAAKVRTFKAGERIRAANSGALLPEEEIARISLASTQAMALCKNLRHVTQGPIDARARPLFYSALRESGVSSLDSLNMSDCHVDGYSWSLDIAQTLALPDLRRLELNSCSPQNTPNRPIAFLPCRLTFLRLDESGVPGWTIAAILLVGPTLKQLSLDTLGVRDFPEEEMQMAWAGMLQLEELMADTREGSDSLQLAAAVPFMPKLRRLGTTIYDLADEFLTSLPRSVRTLQLLRLGQEDVEILKSEMCTSLQDSRWSSRPLEVMLALDGETESVDVRDLQELGRSKGVTIEWFNWLDWESLHDGTLLS